MIQMKNILLIFLLGGSASAQILDSLHTDGKAIGGTVREAIEQFQDGRLEEAQAADVVGHW